MIYTRRDSPWSNPRPHTHAYWATLSLALAIGSCILMTAYANRVEADYARERQYDILYQRYAELRRECLYLYTVQAAIIQDQTEHPNMPKPRHAY